MNFQEEKNLVFNNFLNRTFFKVYKEKDRKVIEKNELFYGNYRSLELMMNDTCSANCSYCYLKKHGNDYYPETGLRNNKNIFDNTKKLFDWMAENDYNPKLELFSGDPLFQKIGYEILELLLDYLKEGKLKIKLVSIPTNAGWFNDDSLVEKVEILINEFKKYGCNIGLSFSIDGKYLEKNRPFVVKNYKYDDKFYEKVFKFAAKYQYGFHPMIYSEGIELWKDNFLWFQEMLEKYKIPWNNIYLLEVRNEEWSLQQMLEFNKFMRFLINWTWEKVGKNINDFISFTRNGKGFNILSSTLSTTGRGIGCSIQSTFSVRLGDLSIFPCHRLQYTQFKSGMFEVENEKISGIVADNSELYYAINSLDTESFPRCEQCIFKNLCGGGCLGSQYESTGDIFSPIPNVCRMEMLKIMSILLTYKEIGILTDVIEQINPAKLRDIEIIEKSGLFDKYEQMFKEKQ